MTTQLQLFLIAVAGWMNRHQQAVIEYLQEEKRVLLEQLGKPRRFTNVQRSRLARSANFVGRRRLGQLATIVTPETLLRWFRSLVAKKWTFAKTNPIGQPPVDPALENLVIKLILSSEPRFHDSIKRAVKCADQQLAVDHQRSHAKK